MPINMKTDGYRKAKNRWKSYGTTFSGQHSTLFDQAAEIISREGISQNFDRKGTPQKWPKRAHQYPWPILWKTGRMRARLERTAMTWTHRGRKHINQIFGPMYAKYHHFGTVRLPIRRTVQFTDATLKKLRDLQRKVFLRT